jgi:DNA-binding LytR/AlgR family response regulator
MKTINCIIVDDEPLAMDILERYIEKTPFLKLAGKFSNAFEAIELMHNQLIHLIFLDIQMPDLNGLEFSKTIAKETRIIFTTAFNEYAIEGYKVNALDYLLKPFDYEEFITSALKAKEWFDMNAKDQTGFEPEGSFAVQSQDELSDNDVIFVKSEHKHLKINLRKVLYFEGLKDYVKIWVQDQSKPVLTLLSLKALEENLSNARFMRIHRSYIVALDKITSIEKGQVIINNNKCITIADQYKEKFQVYLTGKMII